MELAVRGCTTVELGVMDSKRVNICFSAELRGYFYPGIYAVPLVELTVIGCTAVELGVVNSKREDICFCTELRGYFYPCVPIKIDTCLIFIVQISHFRKTREFNYFFS